jgi:Pyridoxamine 5'-phosphate oxidase
MAQGPDPSALAELQAASFERANEATKASWPPERRLSGEQLARVLSQRRYAIVASTRRNQRAHATPSSFVWHDGELWLPSVAGAVRVRNVEAIPWRSVVITEGDGEEHVSSPWTFHHRRHPAGAWRIRHLIGVADESARAEDDADACQGDGPLPGGAVASTEQATQQYPLRGGRTRREGDHTRTLVTTQTHGDNRQRRGWPQRSLAWCLACRRRVGGSPSYREGTMSQLEVSARMKVRDGRWEAGGGSRNKRLSA